MVSRTTSGGTLSRGSPSPPPPPPPPSGGGTRSSASRSKVSDQNSVCAIEMPALVATSSESCRRLPKASSSFISSSTVRKAGSCRRSK